MTQIKKVLIIEPNNVLYNDSDKNFKRLTLDNLEDDIEEYIKFYTASTPTDAIEKIILECEFQNETNTNTPTIQNNIIYQNEKEIYYMFSIPEKQENRKNNEANHIATVLNDFRHVIHGKVGIYKENIIKNNVEMGNITMKNILFIFQSKFIHNSLILNVDGTEEEKQFIFSPIDWIKPEDTKNMKFLELEVYGLVLILFIEVEPKDKAINKKASMIYGDRIDGRVIMAFRKKQEDLMDKDNIYLDIDKNTLFMLLCISSINDNDLKDNDLDNKVNSQNCYTYLTDKFEKYKNMYGMSYKMDKINAIVNKKGISVNEMAYNKIKLSTCL